jgi:hypothetical protein
MSQEDEKIAPCPFCGGESWVRDVGSLWEAFCNNPDCAAKPEVVALTKEKAITAWEDRSGTESSSAVAGSYGARDSRTKKLEEEIEHLREDLQSAKDKIEMLARRGMSKHADQAAVASCRDDIAAIYEDAMIRAEMLPMPSEA